jgi:hypothetical protein
VKSGEVEDRMLTHCWYIFKYAVVIQKSREERAKRWRFDKNSFIYVTKEQRRTVKELWASVEGS